ncbi:MAG: hypothetical protein ACKO6J_05295, partial [Crocinitomicaceae bacterium]
CAISSMILLPSCKRLLNKDSKGSSKEVSKDANDGANSKKDGAGENDKMNTPATQNPQGTDNQGVMDYGKKHDPSDHSKSQTDHSTDPNTVDGQSDVNGDANDGPGY